MLHVKVKKNYKVYMYFRQCQLDTSLGHQLN